MNTKYLEMDSRECEKLAIEIFAEISGMNRDNAKGRRIREGGMAIHETASESMKAKLEYCFISKDELNLNGDTLNVGDVNLKCQAWQLVNPDWIDGVIIYAGCAGEFTAEEETVLNQVYIDLWGSAYTDAMRYILRDRLMEDYSLSESFGPGFYGMAVSEISSIGQLLDFDRLGIRINNRNVMIPVKSCCGIYFVVNDKYEGIGSECAYCAGNEVNCQLCSIYNDRKNNDD